MFARFDDKGQQALSVEEVVNVFREIFHPKITIEEVDGIVCQGSGAATVRLGLADFLAVVSRYMRIHEHDESLLQCFRDLMGEDACDGELTADMLVRNSHTPMTRENAEELLWATAWDGDAKGLSLTELAAIVLLSVDVPLQALPPVP